MSWCSTKRFCSLCFTFLILTAFATAELNVGAEKLKAVQPSSTSLKILTSPSGLSSNATSTIEIRLHSLGDVDGTSEHHFQGGYYSYTVPGLEPDTWYGVEVKSVTHDGVSEISHVDTSLAHTEPLSTGNEASVDGGTARPNPDPVNPVTILAAWSDRSVDVAWRLDHPMTFKKVVGKSFVVCGSSANNQSQTVILTSQDPNGTTRLNLSDARATILQNANATHKWVDVEVKYGDCTQFCLSYWVYVSSTPYFGQKRCQDLADAKERLFLQSLKYVLVSRDKMTVVTSMVPQESKVLIHRVAVELIDIEGQKQVSQKFFDAIASNYTVSELSANKWYILSFKNIVERPVKYLFEQQRLLKTGNENQTEESRFGQSQELEKKINENGSGELVSKYNLLELSAHAEPGAIVAAVTSLQPDNFDLKMTIKGPCSLQGKVVMLTKENPTWKTKLVFPELEQSSKQNDVETNTTVPQTTNGISSTRMNPLLPDNTTSSTIASTLPTPSSEVQATGSDCKELCWDYEIYLRGIDKTFPIGQECLPVYRLVGEQIPQHDRDDGLTLKSLPLATILALVVHGALYFAWDAQHG